MTSVETTRGTDGRNAAEYEPWGASLGRGIALFTKPLPSAGGKELLVKDRSYR